MNQDSPKDRSYYCDKCGFLAEKREKLRSHMGTVHMDGDFSIKGGNLGFKENYNKYFEFFIDVITYVFEPL